MWLISVFFLLKHMRTANLFAIFRSYKAEKYNVVSHIETSLIKYFLFCTRTIRIHLLITPVCCCLLTFSSNFILCERQCASVGMRAANHRIIFFPASLLRNLSLMQSSACTHFILFFTGIYIVYHNHHHYVLHSNK